MKNGHLLYYDVETMKRTMQETKHSKSILHGAVLPDGSLLCADESSVCHFV